MAWGLWRDSAKPLDTAQSDRLPRAAFSAFGLGLGTQLTNPKPAFLFSAIFIAAVQPDTPIWVYGVLFAMVFLNEASWNILVARIFPFDRTRAGYINLKTIIDRAFGGMLALLGFKIAAT